MSVDLAVRWASLDIDDTSLADRWATDLAKAEREIVQKANDSFLRALLGIDDSKRSPEVGE